MRVSCFSPAAEPDGSPSGSTGRPSVVEAGVGLVIVYSEPRRSRQALDAAADNRGRSRRPPRPGQHPAHIFASVMTHDRSSSALINSILVLCRRQLQLRFTGCPHSIWARIDFRLGPRGPTRALKHPCNDCFWGKESRVVRGGGSDFMAPANNNLGITKVGPRSDVPRRQKSGD